MKAEKQEIEKAGQIIRKGGLVLFPTETVYGIGADGLNEVAVRKIFIAKGRQQDNPLILHICNQEMLKTIVKEITPMEKKLIKHFWPGPFTLILKRTDEVPDVVTAGLDTVGVRFPNHLIAQSFIKQARVPIAAPSANLSGKPSGTNLTDIQKEFQGKVDLMLDGGDSEIGLESTVVRVIDETPHILRPGKITPEEIRMVAGDAIIDSHILGKLQEGQTVNSPGMKYRHYAPQTKCMLVYSEENQKLVEKVKQIANKYKNPLILSTTENKGYYTNYKTIDMGEKQNLEQISKNLFKNLRKVDTYHCEIVIIEGTTKEGMGLAIMNRLLRACEYQYIEC